LDERLNPVPFNTVGEMYISGDGVARGYLNRADLTSERFINNPFVEGERMYKTGDLAKRLNSRIEYLGRSDDQVKVRGYRIELGEIESQVQKHPGIIETVVIVNEGKTAGDKTICAYVVSETKINTTELRKHLSQTLPEYMLPSYFVQLDKMPLTPNGKLDRKALPVPEGNLNQDVQYVAPSNKLESQLVSLWEEVLNIKTVGIKDNFFELGGHSIKAVQIVSKLNQEMKVDLTLRDIFSFPTIEQFSKQIQQLDHQQYHFIPQLEQKQTFPASSAQKRMYVLQQLEEHNTSYNMPSVMTITGALNQKRFEKAMYALVKRHESLRTSFEMLEGELVQRIHDQVDVE
ncbi:condensation domain-containing protein, partial [Chengkuizengella marina]